MTGNHRILVVGIGNPLGGDDGIGPATAREIGRRLEGKVTVAAPVSDGLLLMDRWREYACVYLVDAVSTGGPAGGIHRFDILENPPPAPYLGRFSSHLIPFHHIVDLARVLDMLPLRLVLYGVEGADFAMGAGLSQKAARAVLTAADAISFEIEKGCRPAPSL